MRAGAERGQKLAGVFLDFVDGQHDQRLAADVGDADDVGRDEGVPHRQPQAIGRGFEDLGLQGHAIAQIGNDHDGDVELATNQKMFQITAIVLDGTDFDPGQARR